VLAVDGAVVVLSVARRQKRRVQRDRRPTMSCGPVAADGCTHPP